MHSLSDSSLDMLNSWMQWIGIGSLALALVSAVGLFFVSAETGRRQESKLKERDDKIAALQPKPLKERVLIWIDTLDNRVNQAARQGQRVFEIVMTYAQISELQRLCTEDQEARYIRQLATGNTIIGRGLGEDISARFEVKDALFH